MMSMQEDAKSRKLSSEVMKNRLYESVLVSPHRKRSQRAAMHASVMNGDVYSDEVTEMYMHLAACHRDTYLQYSFVNFADFSMCS